MMKEQPMSIDEGSPAKKGRLSHNSSASSSVSMEVKPLKGTWADEVCAEDDNSIKSRRSSLNSSNSSSIMDTSKKSKSPSDTDGGREISLEFIEGVNEEKFERLIKEEKLKTPFKRRHSQTPSNESRSNSPNSNNSNDGDANYDSSQATLDRGHKKEKRLRKSSYSSSSSSLSYVESDPIVLDRRQKQIDYGKNTAAYTRYQEVVPKSKRSRDHPRTPNKHGKYSRRAFDGLIKIWRKQLHYYDPPKKGGDGDGAKSSEDDDSD